MNWKQLLTAVRNSYRNASNPNQPISKANYLAMLEAFRLLVSSTNISGAYDTDFRRNLPGGGLSGLQVPSLPQRITDAEMFASNNLLYPAAGEGIAENIRAIIDLTAQDTAQEVLGPLQDTFQKILDGNF